jgi:hypothetical protein
MLDGREEGDLLGDAVGLVVGSFIVMFKLMYWQKLNNRKG